MDLECEANIKKIDLSAKVKKSQVVRLMRVKLERVFDPLMARAIGADAQTILETLKSGGQEKAVMAIDSVVASLDLHVVAVGAGKTDSVRIPKAIGRKAIATAPNAEEDDVGPTIVLEFEFAFSEQAWAWFGRNVGGYASIEVKDAQLKLTTKKAS